MSESPSQVAAPASASGASTAKAAPPPLTRLSPGRALTLPIAFAAALVGMAVVIGPIRRHPHLFPTFLGAAGVLLLWTTGLFAAARRAGRTLTLEISLRKHHWVQACAQIGVLLYWGWYVRFVYAFTPLILAQLLFAYGVESLLHWSRRDHYKFGFGPFPVVLSINLFLWFQPDWFHWQFLMILVGYLGKELIRWNRDGRSAHIFNPSSFPLGVVSLGLILTGATDMTLGTEIAQTQFHPPHIYLLIFLVSIPGQVLFGVARMTLPAVVTLYAVSALYFQATGTFIFYDAYISLPIFLGMHLLFTDPSTSPRTESGQILFGVLYALGTLGSYLLLSELGAPRFYDKLLPVPFMNLMVRRIDHVMRSKPWTRLDPARFGRALSSGQRNFAYTAVWAGAFLALSAVQGVGDDHPGQYLPFWEEACRDGSDRACEYATFMRYNYCDKGSGWACNAWAIEAAAAGLDRRADLAFRRGCDLGFSPACENRGRLQTGESQWARAAPRLEDLPIVLRGSKAPIEERDSAELYARGCEQGWPGMCDGPSAEARR